MTEIDGDLWGNNQGFYLLFPPLTLCFVSLVSSTGELTFVVLFRTEEGVVSFAQAASSTKLLG